MTTTNKIHTIILVFTLALIIIALMTPQAMASDAITIAEQISALPGLDAIISGNEITVTATEEAATLTKTLGLNIDAGLIVKWQAELASSLNAYLFDLNGEGIFEISYCTIISRGSKTAGVLHIMGPITVNVENNGALLAEKTGNPILISSGNATVNVNFGGCLRSLSGNSNAAIQINSSIAPQFVAININGGSVISDTSGYAINDGAGTDAIEGNITAIRIMGGTVSAASNSAIHTTGMNSTVVVSGGVVSNAAGNNFNPAIDMVGDLGSVADNHIEDCNIIVNGTAIVQSTSQNGYAIQTRGNVLVTDNAQVASLSGRAINLVGLNSCATIGQNAIVRGSGLNVISTATSENLLESVKNSHVIVEGGLIENIGNGNAINITGANSSITVNSGVVKAKSGNAINANTGISSYNNVASFKITINGGVVSSATGNAIDVFGAGVDSAIQVSGGQISATIGLAIHAASANTNVRVSGGFVFAYGNEKNNLSDNIEAIIAAPSFDPVHQITGGFVIIWLEWYLAPINYAEGNQSQNGLRNFNPISTYHWNNHPSLGGGINYVGGGTQSTGFFPVNIVEIYTNYGLIFDSDTGYMYSDDNNNGVLDIEDRRFLIGGFSYVGEAAWKGEPGKLTLNNFSWVTNTQTALIIIGNTPTTIEVNKNSLFESTHDNGVGIKILTESLTIDGKATLNLKGSREVGCGLSLGNGELIMHGGTLIAQGGLRAIDWQDAGEGNTSGNARRGPYGPFYRWQWSKNYDGSGSMEEKGDSELGGTWNEGFGQSVEFEYYSTDHYVMLQSLTPVSFSAMQIGGISKLADSVGISLIFTAPVGELTVDDIDINNISGKAVAGTLAGAAEEWLLMIEQVEEEGDISIKVHDFESYYIDQNEQEVAVYKGIFAAGDADDEDQDNKDSDNKDQDNKDSDNKDSDNKDQDNKNSVASDRNKTDKDNQGGGQSPQTTTAIEQVKNDVFSQEHVAYIIGYPNGRVYPESIITRAEVAMIFYRLLADNVREANLRQESTFTDVHATDWFYNAVSVLANLEIITGYPDKTYRPKQTVTRAEIAAMAARFSVQMGQSPLTEKSFNDIAANWAADDIEYSANLGWLNGYGDGTYRPEQEMTRAEFVSLVNRMTKRLPETIDDILSSAMIRFSDNADIKAWYYLDIQEAANSHTAAFKDKMPPGLQFNYEYWLDLL
ncbi:MAG: S-layer homology domain-containing protein [Firmicutes bacterium]|nr:S-layer homology domain-containing protein [Bacillota bacterium]